LMKRPIRPSKLINRAVHERPATFAHDDGLLSPKVIWRIDGI
jgi:hypothetical protein